VIDSHAHIFLCERSEEEIVSSAREAGIDRMLNVGLGGISNQQAIGAAERHEEVYASVGWHPTEAHLLDEVSLKELADHAGHPEVRAIGETGLDYYRDKVEPPVQREAFEAQVELAGSLGKPIVIHARDLDGETNAIDEVFEVLDAQADGIPVVLHCFSAPQRAADAAERGWHCSFAGHTTYPKSEDLRRAAAELPEELLLVETDSPYLAPQPLRGKTNEPVNVVETARVVAEARGVAYEELERAVDRNARALFGW